MHLSHLLTDVLIVLCGVFVFFRFLSKLHLNNTILWESFVLSVVFAAGFGVIGWAGYPESLQVTEFFSNLASITGGVGLAAAAMGLAFGKDFGKTTTYMILVFGFLLFAVNQAFIRIPESKYIATYTPIIAMSIVALAGIIAMIRKKPMAGAWLLAAVIFFSLAQFRTKFFGSGDSTVDVYHVLVAGGILCLGLANSGKRA